MRILSRGRFCVIFELSSFLSKNLSWNAPRDVSMTPQGPELQPLAYLTHDLCEDLQGQHFRTRYAPPKVIGGRFGAHTAHHTPLRFYAHRGERQLLRLLRIERLLRLKTCRGTLLRLLSRGAPRPQLLRIGSHHAFSTLYYC